MRQFILPLLAILLFAACQKESTTTKTEEQIATANKPTTKIKIPTTKICRQVWMDKNLDVTTYRNGDVIQKITDLTECSSLTTGAWCYYNNDPANGAIYGKLYNWYAVTDPRGLAPIGWHIPTDAEWTTLVDCLGGGEVAGGKMKSVGTIEGATGLWVAPNTGATNSSGFTGLPGGHRGSNDFLGLGQVGVWWSSTEYTAANSVFIRFLDTNNAGVGYNALGKLRGFYVRCLKD